LLEFRIILLTKEVINNVLDLGILKVLELDQVVPISIVEAAPVVNVLNVFGHFGPDIVKVEVVGDVDFFVSHFALLKDKPLLVVTKAESNCNCRSLLLNRLLRGHRGDGGLWSFRNRLHHFHFFGHKRSSHLE